jgi:hypothetical protein
MPDVPLLGQDAARERKAENSPPEVPEAPKVIPARTAIMIIVTPEGETVLANDINLPIQIERTATRDEAYGMLATAMKDMQVEEVAAHTAASTIAQVERKQQEALAKMQNAQLHQHINQNGGIRGGRG